MKPTVFLALVAILGSASLSQGQPGPDVLIDTLYPSSSGSVGRWWWEVRQYFVYSKSYGNLVYIAPPSGPDDHYMGWIKFPFDNVPDTLEILSATLHFYQYEALRRPRVGGGLLVRDPDITSAYDLYFSPSNPVCDTFPAPDIGWVAMPVYPDVLLARRPIGWAAFEVYAMGSGSQGRAYGSQSSETPWLEVTWGRRSDVKAVGVEAEGWPFIEADSVRLNARVTNIYGVPALDFPVVFYLDGTPRDTVMVD